MSDQTDMQVEGENKKRKEREGGAKGHITEHFQRSPKSKPPSALKTSTRIVTPSKTELEEPQDPECEGRAVTYLYVMIDVPPDKDSTGRYRSVLAKLFTTLKTADPDAVILPYEAKPKILTEAEARVITCERIMCIDQVPKIPRSITQLHKYFPKGKPKRGGGTIFTNCLILHNEDIDDIILDLKEGINSYNPRIGRQRVQHHDVVKLGYMMCLTTKIELSRWTEFFEKRVGEIMKEKVLLALSASKINDGTSFKDGTTTPVKDYAKRKKLEYWGIHLETVKSKQVGVKRAVSQIIKQIPEEMYGMEIRFMPQMRYDMNSNQKQRLRNAMMKHRQVLANLVEFKLTDFEDIDSPIRSLENRTIRQLIMSLKAKNGDSLYIAIERDWNRELTVWAKRKYKTEAETYASHMAAWLHKYHGNDILAKLDPQVQDLVNSVVWRDELPLYPEEAEIEDAGNLQIDWLIDMEDLEIKEKDDRSLAMDDVSIASFGEKSWFSRNDMWQQQDDMFQGGTHQPLVAHDLSNASDDEGDEVEQSTTDAQAQSSQGVGDYGRSSALD